MDHSQLSFEQRIQMKKNGFCDPPSYPTRIIERKIVHHKDDDSTDSSESNEEHIVKKISTDNKEKRPRKRANKNCPREVTSKKPVGRFREVIEVTKREIRDPRFSSLSGKYNPDLFSKTYAFLDEYKENEIQQLKDQLKKTKDTNQINELRTQLTKYQQEKVDRSREKQLKSLRTKRKQEEKTAIASGKKPFYLKRSEKKRMELKAKYQELQTSGKLETYMAKKRKKNASKDHRWLPTQRKH